MRADAVEIPGTIAVEAQKLKPAILRKALLPQPGIKNSTASTDFMTMVSAIVLHMVYSQNISTRLATAHTNAAIRSNDFLAQVSIPGLMIGHLTAFVAYMLSPITIGTKHLKVWRKIILSQPLIKTPPIAGNTAMLSAITIHVVYRKKCGVRFTTNNAEATIYGKYFITKFIHIPFSSRPTNTVFLTPLILSHTTLLTKAALLLSRSKTLDTKSLLSSQSIRRGTLLTLAEPAIGLQSILSALLLTKVGSHIPLLTPGAILLGAILGYNIHTEETNPFFRHAPGCYQHRRGTPNFTPSIPSIGC